MSRFARSRPALAAALLAASALPASAAERFALQTDLDHVWTMIAAGLVFLMQVGFLLLEAGSVRSKNTVNVAQKNLVDFLVSTVAFGSVGFMLMFGASQGGWFGFDPTEMAFGAAENWHMTFFVFQLMFCGTAATIVSGAVAERMSMGGYIACTALVGVLIYPMAGHWAWGGFLTGDETFLAAMGFIDFAGGTVVHVVGGAVALAAIIVIGPREGRFDADGTPRTLHGHSPVLATAGCLVIWVGWIGFNGGSTVAGTDAFAHVVMNTMIAGAMGGFVMMVVGRLAGGRFRPSQSINGSLAGLVAITPACDAVTAQAAVLIGMGGGAVAFLSAWAIERLRLDDPLDAVSVHGAGGLFGTVMTGVLARPDALMAGGRLEQVGVQVFGALFVLAWAFGVALVALKAAAALLPAGPRPGGRLRVSPEAEREGLNVAEHDAPMGTGVLTQIMARLALDPDAEIDPIDIEVGDDAHEMAVIFNRIVGNVTAKRVAERDAAEAALARHVALHREIGAVIDACGRGEFDRRLDIAGKEGFEKEVAEGVNRLCEATSGGLSAVGASLEALARGDLSRRVEGDWSGQMGAIRDAVNGTLDGLSGALDGLHRAVRAAARGEYGVRIDLDGREGFVRTLCEDVNAICRTAEAGLDDLRAVLDRIAAGDLTARMGGGYQGRFAEIGEDINAAARMLSDLVEELALAAGAVARNATETAGSSRRLHAQSEDGVGQAAATVAALERIDGMARRTGARSEEAARRCALALGEAREGNALAEEAARHMAAMDRTAREIAGAIEQIGDIAFRTNLLALNAAVEAAHSGGGKSDGFKVVAGEVRLLAAQTEAVVSGIREKARAVRDSVAAGSVQVAQTRENLTRILASVDDVTAIVDDLAAAGSDQVARVSEAHAAVAAIDAHARQGLGLADAARGVADELARNAERTRTLLSQLTTDEPAARAA